MKGFSKAVNKKFNKLLKELVEAYGGHVGGQYEYVIPTSAGDLYVSSRDDHKFTWHVPMRFENTEKAVEVLTKVGKGLGNLNEYSGKYNVHLSDALECLKRVDFYIGLVAQKNTTKIVRVKNLSEVEVGEVIQMTSNDFGGVQNRIVKIADDFTGLNRDIAYFGFYDRMKGGVPTAKKFGESMMNNHMTSHTFAIWGHSMEHGTQLDKFVQA
jgi:hypothetical protein